MEIAIHTSLPAKGDMQIYSCCLFYRLLIGENYILHCTKGTEIAIVAYFIYL